MFGLGPIIGPLLGGYLQFYIGWQANFIALATLMLLMSILPGLVAPETHFNRQPLRPQVIARNMREILSHRQFIGMVISMGAVYSLSISFNTVGPFLIQDKMGQTPIFFGHIALLLGIMFMIAMFMCRMLLNHYPVGRLQSVAISWSPWSQPASACLSPQACLPSA